MRFADRHARRLQRDARALDLGEVDPERARRALEEAAAAAFGGGDGALRLQASRDGAHRVHLVVVPRALGADPERWRAVTASIPHEGRVHAGVKVSNRLLHALAGDEARASGVEEALLFDTAGWLVEGTRSNVFVVDAAGRLTTPSLERGGVAGVAREVLRERVTDLAVRDRSRRGLGTAREIIAVNALRGARPVVELDGRRVGDGAPGPWAERLAELLAAD